MRRVAFTVAVSSCALMFVSQQCNALGVHTQFFNDPRVKTTGVSIGLNQDIGTLLTFYTGYSYRFSKKYQVQDSVVATDDLVTEFGIGIHLVDVGPFDVEPFATFGFSNWYFEYQDQVYIEQWQSQLETGVRLNLEVEAPFQSYFYSSYKTGFFEGDKTGSAGFGIRWKFKKFPLAAKLDELTGQIPEEEKESKENDVFFISGYWVVIEYQKTPAKWQLNYPLLNDDVKKFVRLRDKKTQVYLGPFTSREKAEQQWRKVKMKSRPSDVVFEKIQLK